MEKTAAKIIIILSALLFLVACGGEASDYPETYEANDYVLTEEAEEIEFEVEEQDIEDELAVEDIEEDIMEYEPESPIDIANFVPPTMEISEYGRQVAIEFLSEMTTIFTGMPRAETAWDEAQLIAPPTGLFWVWDNASQQIVTIDEVPEVHLGPTETGQWVFLDRYGSYIYDAPWLYAFRGDDWVSYNYAGYFRLFDFDDDGIPEIFVHFNQTFDGGYAGFYRIYKYVDGQYRALGADGWISSMNEFFWDDSGRIITFVDSPEYHGIAQYDHFVLKDDHIELHLVASMNHDEFDVWREHHWGEWGRMGSRWVVIDGWLHHNPTIFGTDIPLTPIQSLTSLENEITAIILKKLGLD